MIKTAIVAIVAVMLAQCGHGVAKQQNDYQAASKYYHQIEYRPKVKRPKRVKRPKQHNFGNFLGTLHITRYCATGHTTASGKWPKAGMVATMSRNIPFGTRLHISGLGTYVVEDRIGYGSDIDIYTPGCVEGDKASMHSYDRKVWIEH